MVLKFFDWTRSNSPWGVHFCSGCCSLEILALMGPRFDWERYGFLIAPSPRQSDFIIVTGLVSRKVLPALLRVYQQMPEPRYVIGVGTCASGGGPYWDSDFVATDVSQYIPFDVFVAGCPPNPEAMLEGFLKLKEIIRRDRENIASKHKNRMEEISY
jgi:NADH-quinone oxidoreductase subunit B